MTKKKAVVFLEGNQRQAEEAIHELQKLTDEANSLPELTASLQTTGVVSDPEGVEFSRGGEE